MYSIPDRLYGVNCCTSTGIIFSWKVRVGCHLKETPGREGGGRQAGRQAGRQGGEGQVREGSRDEKKKKELPGECSSIFSPIEREEALYLHPSLIAVPTQSHNPHDHSQLTDSVPGLLCTAL